MTALDWICLSLAGSALVSVWRHGSLFASLRAVLELKGDYDFWGDTPTVVEPQDVSEDLPAEPLPPLLATIEAWTPPVVAALLSCSFCLSYWVAPLLGLLFWAPSLWLPEPLSSMWKFPIYALAATHAGNLLTGWLSPSGPHKE